MLKKMIVVKEVGKTQKICFTFNGILEMTKENGELVAMFSELVKINEKVNGIKEKYHFEYLAEDSDKIKDYFNDIMNGKVDKIVEKGTMIDFLYGYIKTNFPKYTDVPGLTVANKAKLIINEYKLNSKIRR